MSYLEKYGRKLIANGYNITPIKPGTKHPSLTNWTNRDSATEIDSWLEGPMRGWGVGILARNNPAIDIDCDDPEVVHQVFRAVREIVGDVRAYRIGRAPRVLLVCRTDEPFKKLRSTKYEDTLLNTIHQVEILADGQQFAAYHVHPDTHLPYSWPGQQPNSCPSGSLPTLSPEQANEIIKAFEAIASEQVRDGRWRVVSESTAVAIPASQESWLLTHRAPTQNANEENIRRALEVLSADDYDRWLQVGMILHHQFNGDEHGFEIWDQWSGTSANYASSNDCRYRWDRFTSDTRASTVTVGSLYHWAEEARAGQATDALAEIEKLVADCSDFHDLLAGRCMSRLGDWCDLYPLYRDRVVDLVKRRARDLSGSPVSVEVVRRALKRTKPVKKEESLYPWAEPYVWLADEDRFFHMGKRISYSRMSFDAEHNRLLTIPGKRTPSASTVALEEAKIPHVEGARYLPGAEPLFTLDGMNYVNRYNPDESAAMPDGMLSPADILARQMFARHVQTLIPDETDRLQFIDYLTYVVQNPGKKLNFAIILRGVEGDGKTFFHGLMRLVLGPNNCSTISGTYLEEKYTAWAEGSQLCFIEEIKMHGISGHETMNKFKEYVTNDMVTIRKMHRSPYSAPNVTSYILLTNYRDALPLSAEDTRYYPIFSRWDTQAQLEAWKAENPRFFHDLFDACQAAPGSIRKWFLERDISTGFDPSNRAPKGAGKQKMIDLGRDDVAVHIQDILENRGGEFGKNEELLSSTWLLWQWNYDGSGISKPGGRRLNTVLMREGWVPVNILKEGGTESDRVSINNRNHRLWTKKSGGAKVDNSTGKVSDVLFLAYTGEEPI